METDPSGAYEDIEIVPAHEPPFGKAAAVIATTLCLLVVAGGFVGIGPLGTSGASCDPNAPNINIAPAIDWGDGSYGGVNHCVTYDGRTACAPVRNCRVYEGIAGGDDLPSEVVGPYVVTGTPR